MNVQGHSRIEHIKQLSGHLRRALVFAQYVLWLGWPLMLLMVFAPDMALFKGSIGEGPTQPFGSLPSLERNAIVAAGLVNLALTQLAVLYLRRLMEHFNKGQVFDAYSLATARKAINCGLGLLGLQVIAQLGSAIYMDKIHFPGPLLTVFYGFLFFGMLHVMLWALEIGRDLNEEAELTI